MPPELPMDTTVWRYTKDAGIKTFTPKPKPEEKDFTPGFDFSEKIEFRGKERKIELRESGLYVFDKKEKFDVPKPPTPPAAGLWIGVKHPMSDGRVIIPLANKPSDFKTVKVRGRTIRGILELTKKTR